MPTSEPPWYFKMDVVWIEMMGSKVIQRGHDAKSALSDILKSSWFRRIIWKIAHKPPQYQAYWTEMVKSGEAMKKIAACCDDLEELEKQACEEWSLKGMTFEEPMKWARAIQDEWENCKAHRISASHAMISAARIALRNYIEGECPEPVRDLLKYREALGRGLK
ncbi:hypothetical protein VTN31DRAFT_3163 [Thermomyces dupontii]|uniref:uncharacterized protein n=1 Tax=Talaromyces thermophilus TaxID=28565 RepID=UPI0037436477